ncbi:MAG: M23 family metallopeptidase [Clostridia bacterium]|nr:M23 family metallopeptidase [Clostridia bacterium]
MVLIVYLIGAIIGAIIEAVRGAIDAVVGVFSSAINIFKGPPAENSLLYEAVQKKLAEIGDVSAFGMTEGGVKNYLSRFIWAELATTYPDMSESGRGEGMQGNVKFYRLTQSSNSSATVHTPNAVKSSEIQKDETGTIIHIPGRMIYMKYDEFMAKVNNGTKESFNDIFYRFTIKDGDPHKVIIAYFSSNVVEHSSSGRKETFNIYTEEIDIYPVLSDYVMPFELPLIFMLTTRSAAFAEKVSELSLYGKVEIGVYDNSNVTVTNTSERIYTYSETTETYTATIQEGTYKSLQNIEDVEMVDKGAYSIEPKVTSSDSTKYVTIKETDVSNVLYVKPLQVMGWIAELQSEYAIETTYGEESEPQDLKLTADEEAQKEMREVGHTRITSHENPSAINSNEVVNGVRDRVKKETVLDPETVRKKFDAGEGVPIYDVNVSSIDVVTKSRTEITRSQTVKVDTVNCIEKSVKRLSREKDFLGIIKNKDGDAPDFLYVSGERDTEGRYDPNGKYVKYLNMDYDEKIFGISINKEDEKKEDDEEIKEVKDEVSKELEAEREADEKRKYIKIDLPASKDLICHYIANYNSTANLEGIIRYLISVISGEKDPDAVSVDDFINGFKDTEFTSVGSISGESVSDAASQFIRSWEGYGKKTADGKYYIVVMVPGKYRSTRTVGYGIDLDTSGYGPKVKAAGYSIEAGSKIPVELIDKFEKEEQANARQYVLKKTKGLNLNEAQITALVAMKYQYGNLGNFVQMYKKYGNTAALRQHQVTNGYHPWIKGPERNGRAAANWKLFNQGKYINISGKEIVVKEASYSGGAMKWPTSIKGYVSSPFGMRMHPISGKYKMHKGIDIAGTGKGAKLLAAAGGTVSFVRKVDQGGYGIYLKIDHGGGIETLYGHASKILVNKGDKVSAGQTVAIIGTTGSSTGIHLHFEVQKNGNPVDPMNYLK